MNLADFPISVLQRAQRLDPSGQKLDRIEFQASRYDPIRRQRIAQKVTLTSTARDGLPTPADEHVILALLHVAKHDNNFASPTVSFAPGQLFSIMGWAPNGRSYDRFRDVLRRLKALTIRYENAWWDASGRAYQEEVATGILSAYRLARQTSGPRTSTTELQSWVTWTQQFHASLLAGNLKRLNLEIFFRLRSPAAQRMYRFLDKRFYNTSHLSLDLIEFACGHIGLTEVSNVAVLKRRLLPALEELEAIGFLEPRPYSERFVKVKTGQWRIELAPRRDPAEPQPDATQPDEIIPSAIASLSEQFYQLWDPQQTSSAGPRDRLAAQTLLEQVGEDAAPAILELLVTITRKQWPDCRSFSGAAQKYLPDAIRLHASQEQRRRLRQQADEQRQLERLERHQHDQQEQEISRRWDLLPPEQQQQIRQQVLSTLQGRFAPEAFIRRLCLDHLRAGTDLLPSRPADPASEESF